MSDHQGNERPTVIVRKVVRGRSGGGHGGNWKVAYADFVTAMMAFFLLLWLLNVTTDEQKRGISDYFSPTVVSQTVSGSGGVLGGISLRTEGARVSAVSPPAVTVDISPPEERAREPDTAELDRRLAEREQQQFEEAERALRQAIQESPELAGLNKHLLIDNTPEGLRIQLIDKQRRSMFPSGSAAMDAKTRELMGKIAEIVRQLPNLIAITGHTDAAPYRNGEGYGNWELSSERANASRRALIDAGLSPERIERVTGKAATEPLIPENPFHPSNRRISIVLLREAKVAPVLPPDGLR